MGIALKGPVKKVGHKESLAMGCTELDLLSIRVIQVKLY